MPSYIVSFQDCVTHHIHLASTALQMLCHVYCIDNMHALLRISDSHCHVPRIKISYYPKCIIVYTIILCTAFCGLHMFSYLSGKLPGNSPQLIKVNCDRWLALYGLHRL